ncbi:MAG: LacI family transcriptional regulator [Candidatus Viridilinea halotolerans]|uniref:LacI family transcriptional regulator n=1 Tax=Candidatus Viridilinea halotolerans TaxID=2491704 RepID=A0A426TSV4_9CHLR|nr:MAG: LacI family transcriptional regulator [Candidatus Viridilinea halotolerans]
MAATIRDVAKVAGVGLGTVSRVLNQSPLVSAATRQRVLSVIAELRYNPSQLARTFALGKTLTVAALAPFFTRPSVVERLRGVEATLAAAGYHLVVFNVEAVARRDECLRDAARSDRADGLLIISLAPRPAEVNAFREAGLPVVLIDTFAEGLPGVSIDDVAGGALATNHLIALGHTRIAFIGDPQEDPLTFNFTSSHDRLLGYQQALAAANLPLPSAYQRHGLHGRYEARVLARELLQLPEPPSAIFAASDTQAMGVLEAARDLDIPVPQALAVVGFDDIDIAEYLGLTTVRQPLFESGARAVELLFLMLSGASAPPAEQVPVELVVRRTSAPLG